jgi:putative membrane protein
MIYLRKRVIIDEVEKDNEKVIFKGLVSNKFFEWLLYMVGYAIVLIAVSVMFDNKVFYINNQYYGVYAVLAAIIIYILNKTIKPILVYLTLPITALSLGLFYPIINVFILYIASFILGDNFQINGFLLPFVIAILISILNMFMEGMIIKPIIHKGKEIE